MTEVSTAYRAPARSAHAGHRGDEMNAGGPALAWYQREGNALHLALAAYCAGLVLVMLTGLAVVLVAL